MNNKIFIKKIALQIVILIGFTGCNGTFYNAVDTITNEFDGIEIKNPSNENKNYNQSEATNETEKQVDTCPQPPPGMVCIPGGTFIMGGHDNFAPHEVYVDSFFIDKFEVTNEEFYRCVENGYCKKPIRYKGFMSPKQPAVAIDWYNAEGYCRWAGKRLPTEAEWEKAAGGPHGYKYPWGNEKPSCELAAYNRCGHSATVPVGSFPPNEYGIYDMAGNSYEWVKDWFSDCITGCEKQCGKGCTGKNPSGPCDGISPCNGFLLKILKGGSWYWGEEALSVAWRRPMLPNSGSHRVGFRCAMDIPPKESRANLSPGSEKIHKYLSSPEDEPPEQRIDERHYYHSNENSHYLFFPFIKDIKGGYLGVGADQNYTLIAASKSEIAWIVDYDPLIIKLHKIHQIFIQNSSSPEDFIQLWNKDNKNKSIDIIKQYSYMKHIEQIDVNQLVSLYNEASSKIYPYFLATTEKKHDTKHPTWLSNQEMFHYIKEMISQSRIRAMSGNLLESKALKGIGEITCRLKIPVRVIYLTNVEEFIRYNSNFLEWFNSLLLDKKSVVLRTLCSKQGLEPADYRWHYNVQSALHFREMLSHGYHKIQQIIKIKQPTSIIGLSSIGI